MDGTILCQGSFLSPFAGANPNPGVASNAAADAIVIQIPSAADWMWVKDYTKAGANGLNTVYFQGAANATTGVEWYWQRGMAPETGIVKYKANGVAALSEDTMVSGGFTLYDPSGQDPNAQPLLGPAVAITGGVSNASQPVVTTANTAGVTVGSVVRDYSPGQPDTGGIDFVVSAVTSGVSFTLLFASNALANVPGAAGVGGTYRIVYNGNTQLFYPRRRVVTFISQAVNATVATAIAHGLTVGQEVRFTIPAVSGMVQLNSSNANNYVAATILSVIDDYSFTINVNTTGFTAFTYPTVAQQPSSFPVVNPVGEDTATSISSIAAQTPVINGQQIFNTNTGLLADSTVNTGFLGMILGGGGNGNALGAAITGPSGAVHFTAGNVIDVRDQIYWVAGKSSFGGL